MSCFVSAADNYTPRQFGENANVEYGYSNQLDEKIVQFFFQLVRTNDTQVLEKTLYDMLNFIKGNEKPSVTYANRKGKYMKQRGVTLPKI